MSRIPADYLQRVYAGWLGKIIGIRHGAPIEGWSYWKIRDILGEVDSYPVDFREFAADDDSNGPLFFLRGLETAKDPAHMEPDDVAQALLNYAPFEHGFFWWGGYGISTEHTAYLNLRNDHRMLRRREAQLSRRRESLSAGLCGRLSSRWFSHLP